LTEGGGGRSAEGGGAVGDGHPVSPGQRALWLLHQRDPAGAGAAYTIAAAGRVRGVADPEALRGAFEALVRRHPALRTVFPLGAGPEGEEPVPRVLEPGEAVGAFFEAVDGSAWSEGEVPERLADLAYRPFDLERGPLFRVFLAQGVERSDGARNTYLVLSLHHIVGDLWSLAIVVRELGKTYRALTEGQDPLAGLPELATTHAEWVSRRRRSLAGEEGERLWRFWRDHLGGGSGAEGEGARPRAATPLELPTDRPRPALQSFAGATVARSLEPHSQDRPGSEPRGPVLRRGLGRLARRSGTHRFSVLMAAWQAVLGRWSGQDEFLVGSPTAGRGGARSEIGGVVGYFVNPVAVRAPLHGDPTFADLVVRVGEETEAVLAHQDLPFPWLAEELAERDPSRPPLFQTMMVLQKSPIPGLRGLGAFALGRTGAPLDLDGLELASVPLPQRGAQFDLALFVTEEEGALVGSLEYASELFDRETAERLLGHLATFLAEVVEDADRPISRIPILTPGERRQVAIEWPGGGHRDQASAEPVRPLHVRFLHQAAAHPEAEALVVGEERLTYGDLDRRSRRLAASLRALGVGPEVPVGVFLERTSDLPAALLGVLRAGGAYVPMDPAYPEERVALMAGDSGMTVAVAGEGLAGRLPPGVRAVTPAELERVGEGEPPPAEPARPGAVSPDGLAYVIYTSGSTGRPKGVAITHRSASALVEWAARAFDAGELSGVLAATSVCFDLSVFELLVPLALGGRVILAPDALALPSLPAAGEVRLVNTVPSAMEGLCRVGDEEAASEAGLPPGVRTVCLAGEVLRRRLVDAVYRASRSAGGPAGVQRVLNLYGPSEDTTYSTESLCPAGEQGEPTIGRVLPGSRGYVVDARLGLQPQGVPGELVLGGVGLARGYLGRPALTAERFVPDPFAAGDSGRAGGRLYRTGDLVRWLPGGEVELIGRIDHQVKVRGFRIELGEVEATLGGHPGLREVVVVVRGEGAERRLVAYVVAASEEVTAGALRGFLGGRLPGYMVPDVFVMLEGLPRTPNGKVDRRALPDPPGDRSGSEAEYVAPETEIEILLAEIWRDVLGVERVGIHDSFFELGGHSLSAHRVLVRVRDLLGVEVPVARLFEQPTVAGLAVAIAEVLLEGADDETVAEVLGSFE